MQPNMVSEMVFPKQIMNSITEHLERIKAKCRANLALAEKRYTQGRWYQPRDARHLIYDHPTGGNHVLSMDDREGAYEDAAYIAACAGAAEAGWRATSEEIDGLLPYFHQSVTPSVLMSYAERRVAAILAAWPEELL